MSRTEQSHREGSRLVVARDYRIRSDCFNRDDESVLELHTEMLHKLFKTTELYTLEWQILCYMNFSTLKVQLLAALT